MSEDTHTQPRKYTWSFAAVLEPLGLILCNCSNDTQAKRTAEALNDAEARAADLLRELEAVQWGQEVLDMSSFSSIQKTTWLKFCPQCGNENHDGHTEDCTLAAALRKARGEQVTNPDTPNMEGA